MAQNNLSCRNKNKDYHTWLILKTNQKKKKNTFHLQHKRNHTVPMLLPLPPLSVTSPNDTTPPNVIPLFFSRPRFFHLARFEKKSPNVSAFLRHAFLNLEYQFAHILFSFNLIIISMSDLWCYFVTSYFVFWVDRKNCLHALWYPNSWWQRNLSSRDSIAKPPCPYHPFLLWRRDLRSLQSHDFLTIHGSANSSPLSMAAWLPQALQCEYLSEAELACRQGGRTTIFRWRKNILFWY